MENRYEKIHVLSQNLLDSVADRNAELMAARFDELNDAYRTEFGGQLDDFDSVHVFFEMMYAATVYLSFNNFYAAAMSNCDDAAARFQSICDAKAFSDDEMSVLAQLSGKLQLIRNSLPERHKNTVIPRQDTRCCLCRVRPANKTGSHMVPNFLAHPSFSFDSQGNRGREAMDSHYINGLNYSSSYYGPEVSTEYIAKMLGHDMTDDDIVNNINRLEYDNEFCSLCESRFGILETAYAAYYKNKTNGINSRVAYLFWLSVLWRMSIGRIGLFLDFADELSIHDILNSNIKGTIKEITESEENLGNWQYAIFQADGLKNGDKGIMASRIESSPYVTMYNDLIMVFYHDAPTDSELVSGSIEVKRDNLNSWRDEKEKAETVDRRWFWSVRDWVVQQSYDYYGPAREKAMLIAREIERITGRAFSEEDKRLAVEVSKMTSDPKQHMLRIRKMNRIVMALMRKKEAEADGREYNPLEDEELFLSQKDFENFYEDLQRHFRSGF